jgi:catechol 2,3-dioxygenase-like lactoylglutathione lyase family enzyme
MKLELGAIGICVNHIETMVKFYRDVVGFDIKWDGGSFAGCRLASGIFFNLYQDQTHDRRGINRTFQISCGVELPSQVDKEYSRLIKAGAQSVIPPRDEPYGMRICFVADPEGNQIEICASIDDSV